MENPNNFLNLYDIFVNELIGDPFLTVILALVLVWFLTIKFKMPFELSILFGLLISFIFFAEMQSMLLIWVFGVLIIGLMFYFQLNKAAKE